MRESAASGIEEVVTELSRDLSKTSAYHELPLHLYDGLRGDPALRNRRCVYIRTLANTLHLFEGIESKLVEDVLDLLLSLWDDHDSEVRAEAVAAVSTMYMHGHFAAQFQIWASAASGARATGDEQEGGIAATFLLGHISARVSEPNYGDKTNLLALLKFIVA